MQERIIKGQLATEDSQKKKRKRRKGKRHERTATVQHNREDSKWTKGKRGQLKNKMFERTVKGENAKETNQPKDKMSESTRRSKVR